MFTGAKESWFARMTATARRYRRVWRLTLGGFCFLGGAALCPWRTGIVIGHSMEPTLPPGSLFLYDRTYYRRQPLRSGDVVVVRYGREIWIKRVYAAEGAHFWTLRTEDQEQIRHDPIRRGEQFHFARFARRLRQGYGVETYRVVPIRLPVGSVFVVGDNPKGEDSRVLGPVDASGILGRVVPLPGQSLGSMPKWVELSFPRGSEPGTHRVWNEPIPGRSRM